MNKHDKDNLEFFLTATPEMLREWYDRNSHDDHAYAMYLIKSHSSEIIVENLESVDNVTDLSDAQRILARFTL